MLKLLTLALVLSSNAFAQSDINWKSIFVSGDHSIANFDNGRKVLSQMFADLGAYEEDQVHFTAESNEVSRNVSIATISNIENAFARLNVNPETDGCLIFMTSHGARNQGFYLSRSGILSPARFNQMVNSACKDAPTVILISACFSGQFINDGLKADNRVIMTAARSDRSSFGCSADTTYTYWDHCLIDNLPTSQTWQELHANVVSCIEEKEGQRGFLPSFPQAFFGPAMSDAPILSL